MQTIVLRNRPRKIGDATTWSIEVVGESAIKDAVKESISKLEHHPAKAALRSLVDMLAIIEKHDFKICHTEHYFEEETEVWLFVLQR